MLKKDAFPLRFNQFLTKIRTDDLALEEITAEVETVRSLKNDASKQKKETPLHASVLPLRLND